MNCCSTDVTIVNKGKKCSNPVVGYNWKQVYITEKIQFDTSMPAIRCLRSVTNSIQIFSASFAATPNSKDYINAEGTKLTGLKAAVSGFITQNFIYEGVDCAIYVFTHKEPFSEYIVLDKNTDITVPLCISSCVEDSVFSMLSSNSVTGGVGIYLSAS